jgi:uncharacterized protein YbaP (TraB family)
MFKGKGWALLVFGLAALLAAEKAPAERARHSHRAAAQRGPHPALWLLEDSDTKIYLFGTYHILPHGFRWRTARFDAIAGSADELVLEVANVDAPQTGSEAMAELRLGKSVPIQWRVSPDRRQALQDMVDELGVPTERLDDMQTWAVAMGLAAVQIFRGMATSEGNGHRDGNRTDNPPRDATHRFPGVEGPLEAEFRASHRPVSGVETAGQQMRFFRVLTFAEQRQLLESIVDAYSAGMSMGGEGDIGQSDWVHGNVPAIARETEALRGPLYEVLLRRRNAAWADWLIQRLDRPGTLLFAVGAAHLAGDDSVRAMLAARGFRVRRIQ